ncbi:Lipase [Parasponia andersonii]|uniref:Lipase n=1 Tax=Parasponia andersonii TaxID=3476 RepID=A0A2P5BUQ4_PARAD|nr:Lipase [Parasponia andersonii]
MGTDFEDGANFATGGSSIVPGGFSPFDLGIQVSQFMQFKSRSRAFDDHQNDCRARAFWVHNTGPFGCLPRNAITFRSKKGTLDPYGCVASQNAVAQDFNKQLKDVVNRLRTQFPSAAFTYVDVYSVKFSLIVNAKKEGFVEPLNFCCGNLEPYPLQCGTSAVVNGTTLKAGVCADPWRHINWDGMHYTEAANGWFASRILGGSVSDPPVPIGEACPWP